MWVGTRYFQLTGMRSIRLVRPERSAARSCWPKIVTCVNASRSSAANSLKRYSRTWNGFSGVSRSPDETRRLGVESATVPPGRKSRFSSSRNPRSSWRCSMTSKLMIVSNERSRNGSRSPVVWANAIEL